MVRAVCSPLLIADSHHSLNLTPLGRAKPHARQPGRTPGEPREPKPRQPKICQSSSADEIPAKVKMPDQESPNLKLRPNEG